MNYAIVKTTCERQGLSAELVRVMNHEKESVQFCRDQNNTLNFLSDSHYSVAELLGDGDFTVLVFNNSCQLARAFDSEKAAQAFMKSDLPKLSFPKEWKFSLLAKVDPNAAPETPEEPENNEEAEDENPPLASED